MSVPRPSCSIGSTTAVTVELTVVVVPLTTMFPSTSKLPAIVTSSGKPIVTESVPTITVVSFAVGTNVNVSPLDITEVFGVSSESLTVKPVDNKPST